MLLLVSEFLGAEAAKISLEVTGIGLVSITPFTEPLDKKAGGTTPWQGIEIFFLG